MSFYTAEEQWCSKLICLFRKTLSSSVHTLRDFLPMSSSRQFRSESFFHDKRSSVKFLTHFGEETLIFFHLLVLSVSLSMPHIACAPISGHDYSWKHYNCDHQSSAEKLFREVEWQVCPQFIMCLFFVNKQNKICI